MEKTTKTVVIAHTNSNQCVELLTADTENIKRFAMDMNNANSVNKRKDLISLG